MIKHLIIYGDLGGINIVLTTLFSNFADHLGAAMDATSAATNVATSAATNATTIGETIGATNATLPVTRQSREGTGFR